MAKLCNQAYHCDLSTKGSTTTRTSSPLATIDWYDRVEKVACVKKWYNRQCNCEGYGNVPCGDLAGNLIYNVPNSQAEGSYPTQAGQRIWSESTWQTQVLKSELPTPYVGGEEEKNRRKKIIRNVGIGAGILAAIVGIFALTRKKKNEPTYISSTRQRNQQDEIIEVIDDKTGKITTYSTYGMYPEEKKSDNTILYVVLGVGVIALSVIIIRK